MLTSVVIPVRNDPAGLKRVLKALSRQTVAPDEVIIVNAGDHPISGEELGPWRHRVLPVGGALPGEARNAGASAARTPWVSFLDAGTEPVPNWCEAFNRAADANHDAEVLFGGYVPRIVDAWDWAAVATYLAPLPENGAPRSPTVASMCVRRDTWARLGGMREDLRAGEDLLFFDAVLHAGARTAQVPEALVVWDLPRGVAGHFRRLRSYSRATWGTPLAHRWQIPVLRMYALGALLLAGTFATAPALVPLLAILPLARLAKNLGQRRKELAPPLQLWGVLCLLPMMAISDAATLVGVCDGARRPKPLLSSGDGR